MKTVLHTISSIGARSGGTSSSVANLLKAIETYDVELLAFALDAGDVWQGDGSKAHFIANPQWGRFCYSSDYRKALLSMDYDIVHTTGLWEYTEYITSKVARKRNIPYLISPQGMLYPQALNHSAWLKKFFLKTYLFHDLQKASCIHATCLDELHHIRSLGIKTPIALIPNSIDMPPCEELNEVDEFRFGYCGRLHPRKRVERLLYAWHEMGKNTVDKRTLVIVGDGDRAYFDFLRHEVQRLELRNVIFTGFLSGEAMLAMIRSLSYLVVPSDFESFGMVIAEALSLQIPVIASKGTPWEDLETARCGWWIDNDEQTIGRTMQQAIDLPANDRLAMGKRGRELIAKTYSKEVVASQMSALYDWILGGKNKPIFVDLWKR